MGSISRSYEKKGQCGCWLYIKGISEKKRLHVCLAPERQKFVRKKDGNRSFVVRNGDDLLALDTLVLTTESFLDTRSRC